jgi:acetyl esterase/lipase
MKNFCRILILTLTLCATGWSADFSRTEDVIYGRKFGTALTLDVFTPAKTNGLGIVFMVSGGWYSAHEAIRPALFKPLMERGYVVFTVVHGSQPKFTIPEIEQDIHRAVRYIRSHAPRYGVDASRLGITGASAGGHLSLLMAGKGGPGERDARDPVDRESSAVQCVACFFPPTDFLNYSREGETALGDGILKNFKAAFGPRVEIPDEREKLGLEISPIYFVSSNTPPILIVHGDADKLVPIYQAERFIARCREAGSEAKLVVREGMAHGWAGMEKDLELFADWFDKYLKADPPK